MIVACQNGHARIVKALLRSGANVQAVNRSGNTGLHYACSFGFTVLADFLISQGANDAVRNLAGLTPYEGIK
jgi:ankyrin repeat protein